MVLEDEDEEVKRKLDLGIENKTPVQKKGKINYEFNGAKTIDEFASCILRKSSIT